MPAEPNYIETTEADEPYEPSVTPPKLERADVLTRVRVLAAQVTSFGSLVEQASMNPKMRMEFVDAWRRWAGSVAGWHIALERLPFHADDVMPMLHQREAALRAWRQGFQAETNTTPAVGVVPPAREPTSEPKKKGILSTVPWYVWIPAGVGAGIGVYYGFRWIFRQWFGAADEHVQDVRYVANVVGQAPVFNQQQQPNR